MNRLSGSPAFDSRLFRVLATLTIVIGQVAVMAHLDLVRHGICPLHGELIELSKAAPSATEIPADVAPLACGRLTAAAQRDQCGDDHCAIVLGVRKAIPTPPSPPLSGAIPADVPNTRPVSAARARPQIPTLLLAPKHSPPASAV